MPVYRLGPTAGSGFRSVHSPDPEGKSKVGTVLACAVAILMAVGGCVLICVLLEDPANVEALDLDTCDAAVRTGVMRQLPDGDSA
jgi:hypothetical protein